MRKIFVIFVLILIACIVPAETVMAAESPSPRIILYTYYRQMGWGDRVQIGWLDDEGTVRLITGYDSTLRWPYKPEEQLAYLEGAETFTAEDILPHDDLFSIKSLVYSVEDQGSKAIPAANDAGTEKSYAVQYSKEGEPSFVLLGMSGDDFFENFDPNAQALYLRLRLMFPAVTSYGYGPMGPQGFRPVPLAEFIGLDADAILSASVRGYLIDCEEGPIPLELTEKDITALVYLVRNAKVTGKADCVVSTGGVASYSFYDAEEKLIGTVEFEDGLLVWDAGHYYFDMETR